MNYQPILENDFVALYPLQKEDINKLEVIALEDNLTQYSPSFITSKEELYAFINNALASREKLTAIPFAIFDKAKEQFVGSTRFGNINTLNKVLHIGWTWISKSVQGTGVNKQMKFLMLQYAFEILEYEKVEFRVDERNIRSRIAVERIGGVLEGTLRKDTLMKDGFRRSTCCYGILKSEWSKTKETIFKDFI